MDSRPTVIADTFSLGSLRRTVNHSLNVACRGDFLRFSSLCAVCFSGMVFGYGCGLFGGSVGVLLQKGKNGGTIKIISQFSGSNGFRPVRGKVGQPPSALFDDHTLPQKQSGKLVKGSSFAHGVPYGLPQLRFVGFKLGLLCRLPLGCKGGIFLVKFGLSFLLRPILMMNSAVFRSPSVSSSSSSYAVISRSS